MKAQVRKILLGLLIPIAIVLVWYLVTTYGSIPVGILPTIPMVGDSFLNMLKTGQLQQDILVSMSRVVKGYLISAVLGIVLGSLIGMFRPVKELFVPIITVIRQIPMIAWIEDIEDIIEDFRNSLESLPRQEKE